VRPAQSAPASAAAMVGVSVTLLIRLWPDELSETLKIGVYELFSFYGIH
jgi:hypothetical protein